MAAIRVLKTLEHEARLPTPDEWEALGRFAGFGPVALSVFPDPATGRYKDAGWQTVGEELKALLTSEEYASSARSFACHQRHVSGWRARRCRSIRCIRPRQSPGSARVSVCGTLVRRVD